MQKVKILVVEDEVVMAEDIAYRLESMNYEVVGTAINASEAITLLKTHAHELDLILLDIILEDSHLDGIELARLINEEYQLPFIFLSAQANSYFVERAKSVHPYAYMLKPFNDRALRVAIDVALSNFARATPIETLEENSSPKEDKNDALHINNSLFLKQDFFYKRVRFNDILWLEAEGNYTYIHTTTGRFMYATALGKIEDKLPSKHFLRVHRSYIVNMHRVTGFIKNMLYIDKKVIPVSKAYTQEVFQWFNTL